MLVNENTRRNLEQEIAGFRAHAAAGERAMQARLPFARSHLRAAVCRASPDAAGCTCARFHVCTRSRLLPGVGDTCGPPSHRTGRSDASLAVHVDFATVGCNTQRPCSCAAAQALASSHVVSLMLEGERAQLFRNPHWTPEARPGKGAQHAARQPRPMRCAAWVACRRPLQRPGAQQQAQGGCVTPRHALTSPYALYSRPH